MPSVAVKAHFLADQSWVAALGYLTGELTVLAALVAVLSSEAAVIAEATVEPSLTGELDTSLRRE